MTGDSENSLFSVCFKPVHLLPVVSLLLLLLCVLAFLPLILSFFSSPLYISIFSSFFYVFYQFLLSHFGPHLASHSPILHVFYSHLVFTFSLTFLSSLSVTAVVSHFSPFIWLSLATFFYLVLCFVHFLSRLSVFDFPLWFSPLSLLSVIFLPHSLYPHFTLRSL